MNKIDIEHLVLKSGAHEKDSEDFCLIEACSVLDGSSKNDRTPLVYAPLAAAGRFVNDGPWESDEARTAALAKYIIPFAATGNAGSVELSVRVAKTAARMAREFADNFDASLTPGQRIAKNGPALLDALYAEVVK